MRTLFNPITRLRETNFYLKMPFLAISGRASLIAMILWPFLGMIYKSLIMSWAPKQRYYNKEFDIIFGYSCDNAGNPENSLFLISSLAPLGLYLLSFFAEVWFSSKFESLYHSLRGLRIAADGLLQPNIETLYGRVAHAARKQSLFDSIHVGLIAGGAVCYLTALIRALNRDDVKLTQDSELPTLPAGDLWYRFCFNLQKVENEGVIESAVALSTTVLIACLFQAFIRWRNRSNEATAGYRQLAEDEWAGPRI